MTWLSCSPATGLWHRQHIMNVIMTCLIGGFTAQSTGRAGSAVVQW